MTGIEIDNSRTKTTKSRRSTGLTLLGKGGPTGGFRIVVAKSRGATTVDRTARNRGERDAPVAIETGDVAGRDGTTLRKGQPPQACQATPHRRLRRHKAILKCGTRRREAIPGQSDFCGSNSRPHDDDAAPS